MKHSKVSTENQANKNVPHHSHQTHLKKLPKTEPKNEKTKFSSKEKISEKTNGRH